MHLAGRNMTFLLNPEDFPQFFSSDEEVVDFQYATQPFLSRCFGVPKVKFIFHRSTILILFLASVFRLPREITAHCKNKPVCKKYGQFHCWHVPFL